MPTAIAEPEAQADDIKVSQEHAADPVSTNLGDVFKKALAEEQESKQDKATIDIKPKTKKAAKVEAEKPAIEPEKVEGDKVAEKEKKSATKPADALEAALDAKPKEEAKVESDVNPVEQFKENPNVPKMRETIDSLHRERLRLKGELEKQSKPDPKVREQVDALTKERDELKGKLDEYKDSIVAVNVELDPEFQREFKHDRIKLVSKAADKLKAYGGNQETLIEAFSLPEGRSRDVKIQEAMGEMEDVPKGKILAIIAEIEAKDEKANEIRANSQQAWEKYQENHTQSQAKQSEQAEAQKKDVWEKVTSSVMEKHPTLKLLDTSINGAEEWNATRIQAKNEALILHSNKATPEQTFEAALKGRMFDHVEKLLLDTRAELKQAKSQLAEIEDSQPDIKGGKKPSAKDEKKDPGDVYKETLAKLRGGGE